MSKTVLLQTIQFISICPIDRILSGATTPGLSGPGSDVNKVLLRILQSSSITEASLTDYLVSYTGHSLSEPYSSVEMQSVYSKVPADWAKKYLYIFIVKNCLSWYQPVLQVQLIVVLYFCACIYPTPPPHAGNDTKSIFKYSKAGLNSVLHLFDLPIQDERNSLTNYLSHIFTLLKALVV